MYTYGPGRVFQTLLGHDARFFEAPEFRQAVTAAGTGCMAALEAERYLATRPALAAAEERYLATRTVFSLAVPE